MNFSAVLLLCSMQGSSFFRDCSFNAGLLFRCLYNGLFLQLYSHKKWPPCSEWLRLHCVAHWTLTCSTLKAKAAKGRPNISSNDDFWHLTKSLTANPLAEPRFEESLQPDVGVIKPFWTGEERGWQSTRVTIALAFFHLMVVRLFLCNYLCSDNEVLPQESQCNLQMQWAWM